jgi:glutathione reductase (NADPH)
MGQYDYDLFVLGAGSGGVRASRVAASHGARVAVCEESRVGGTCVIRGCIPKKLMVYSAHFRDDFEDAAAFGWLLGPAEFDWATLIANKDTEIDRLNRIYLSLLAEAGVDLFPCRGVLEDAHTVRLGDRTVSAETLLIATGGAPSVPETPGIEHAITSNEVFHLDSLPARVMVVGGGYIACEFVGIFNGLGAKVTQLYRGPMILRGFDDDIRAFVGQEMKKKGIDVRLDHDIRHIERRGGAIEVTLKDGTQMTTDLLMYATGRAPNTTSLGLERAGVAVNPRGAVVVDEWSRSSAENIYAVGDVTDRINLTPVALNEGLCFAETVYGHNPRKMDHLNVPAAVFSTPSVGTVGMSEALARERLGALDIYKTAFRPLKHTLTGRDEMILMKLVVERKSQRVVGVHMAGPEAAETIQGIAIAVKMGATKAQFDATVGIHPTAAEEFVTMREKYLDPENAAEAAD